MCKNCKNICIWIFKCNSCDIFKINRIWWYSNRHNSFCYIDKQYQQIERLDLIINGLIKLTNLNQSNLEKSTIDFHKLVDDCLISLQAHPRFNSIQFRKEIGEGLDFQSEWTLINAILQNLIENAIKYSVERDPFVRIGIQREDSALILEVEDNGVGIPYEHQSKIFEMFYRGTRHANGSGLGLYILKRSVDRLKGVIDIKSVERNGSTFTVKLPYWHRPYYSRAVAFIT